MDAIRCLHERGPSRAECGRSKDKELLRRINIILNIAIHKLVAVALGAVFAYVFLCNLRSLLGAQVER